MAKTPEEVEQIRQQILQNQQAAAQPQPQQQQAPVQAPQYNTYAGQTKSNDEVQAMRDAMTANQQQAAQAAQTPQYNTYVGQTKSDAEVQAMRDAMIKNQQQGTQPQAQQPQQQQSGMPGVPSMPPVSYDQSGIPMLNMPDYQQYASPYANDIKNMLDQIANTPAYESPYASVLQDMINKMNSRSFDYDPETDPEFQKDSQTLTRAIMEQMNQRGILNSSITADNVSQVIKDLMVSYRGQAYDRYMDEGQQLLQQANFIMGVDQQGYSRYQDERTQKTQMLNLLFNMDDRQFKQYQSAMEQDYSMRKDQYQSSLNQYNAQKKQVSDAWDRVQELGYVDNEASIILGVEAGTLSREANAQKQAREAAYNQSIADMEYKIFELDYKQQQAIEMVGIKAQQDKELENLQASNKATLAAQAQQYKTPTASEIQNASPSQLGSPEQAANYTQIKSAIWQESAGDANAALEIIYTAIDLQSYLGSSLYQKMVYEFEQLAKVQKVTGADNASTFNPTDYYKDAKSMKDGYTPPGEYEPIVSPKEEVIEFVLNSPMTEKQKNDTLTRLGYANKDIQDYFDWKTKEGQKGSSTEKQSFIDKTYKAPSSNLIKTIEKEALNDRR